MDYSQYLWGMGIGYLGGVVYDSYMAKSFDLPQPGVLLSLVRTSPIRTLAPMVGGYLAYSYFGGSPTTTQMGAAIVGGVLGTMFAPRLPDIGASN